MKNILYILFISLISFSCSDNLNIDPEQSLSIDAAFSDENTSRASLQGVYSQMQDLDVFGAMPQIINDFMSDNVNFVGSFPTLNDIKNYNTISDNATTSGIFRDHYQVILAANAVIQFVPTLEDETFSQESRNEIVGEAYFCRAITYFNLVNLFAQPYRLDSGASPGVALTLTPDVLAGGFDPIGRSTVAETYTQIESDLLQAASTLGNNGITRASSGAAKALLSRLYLYKGDWAQAASLAQEVLDDGSYSIASDYEFYDTESSEHIFSLRMTDIDNSRTGSGGWASFYNPAELGARGDCPMSEDLIASFEPGDLRFESMNQLGGNGLTYTTKFPDATNNADDAPLIRTTEVWLNRAEALAKLNGVDQEAVDIVNTLRARAGLAAVAASDFSSGNQLVNQILDERRKELCFEGHRRMDQLRANKAARPGEALSNPGQDKVVMPIPQSEIDLGSSLPQNPGY